MDAVGTSSGGSESSGERGSVLPLLVVVMAVAVAAVLALVAVTEAVVGRAEAQAAADAAALAGVVEGERGADDVAVRNGAVLTAFERRGAVVEVEVVFGGPCGHCLGPLGAECGSRTGQVDSTKPRGLTLGRRVLRLHLPPSMSVDHGPSADTPKVGEALVAALGFEPTDDSGEPDYGESDGSNGNNLLFGPPGESPLGGGGPPKGQLFGTDPGPGGDEAGQGVEHNGSAAADAGATVQVDADGPLFDVASSQTPATADDGPSLFASDGDQGFRVDTVGSGQAAPADAPVDLGFETAVPAVPTVATDDDGSVADQTRVADEMQPRIDPMGGSPIEVIPDTPPMPDGDPYRQPQAEAPSYETPSYGGPDYGAPTVESGSPALSAYEAPSFEAPGAMDPVVADAAAPAAEADEGRRLFDPSDIGPEALVEADYGTHGNRAARTRGFDMGPESTATAMPTDFNPGTMPGGPAVPSRPPVAESYEQPQVSPYQAGVATGGSAGTAAARQALQQQSITDRVGGVASRFLAEGFGPRTRRMRARKVRRVVRHVDPWSVLTFSVLFHLCLFAALLLASVLVWNAAVAAGAIENIENFIRDLGDYQTYEINGDVVFRAAMIIAGILTLTSSLLAVLLTVVFNLISDLVGGIRVTVVEEEVVRVRRRGGIR